MPVESVAAYINNTFTFVMFILVCMLLYLLIFLISTFLRKRVISRNPYIPHREIDGTKGDKSFTGTDPFNKRNTIILGISFILVFLSMMLLMSSYYFSFNMGMDIIIFIISFIILSMILVLVYIFRSGVFYK